MKKAILAVLVVLLCSLGGLMGCRTIGITGSGTLIIENYNFSNFTKVEAHNGFQVELTRSSTYSIEITIDDNLKEDLEVNKSGDTLSIQLKGTRIYNTVTLRAEITIPDLYKLDLSGGSQASITGFSSSHDFSVGLSGGSRESGDITMADADFDLSGGSRVELSGSADDLAINGSGGSQLDLETLPVDKADINLSGGSRATVNVNGTIDINLSGGSRVTYVGEPTMGDIDLSGSSTISKK
jgi:hypothetical protein